VTTSEWMDEKLAARWTAADSLKELLVLPRRISATVIAADRPGTALVVDVGSGPGDYLSTMLDTFPAARGVWTDVSPAMADIARPALAAYRDRVEFRLVDLEDLSPLPEQADVITTSRASHHFDADTLARFYASAADHLAPGGWLVNLDHVLSPGAWDRRLRDARAAMIPPKQDGTGHSHDKPLPMVEEHLAALAAAGFDADREFRAPRPRTAAHQDTDARPTRTDMQR
jgi:SAM-dependent methyltransferase